MKQNKLTECKPRIEMGITQANNPGIEALLTAPHLSFLKGAAAANAAA